MGERRPGRGADLRLASEDENPGAGRGGDAAATRGEGGLDAGRTLAIQASRSSPFPMVVGLRAFPTRRRGHCPRSVTQA
jgi:hypothetical protein